MSTIVGPAGKPVVIIAEVADGVFIHVRTTEELSALFEKHPAAKLRFVSPESEAEQ